MAREPVLTPAEYARELAAKAKPLTDDQIEKAARILAQVADQQEEG